MYKLVLLFAVLFAFATVSYADAPQPTKAKKPVVAKVVKAPLVAVAKVKAPVVAAAKVVKVVPRFFRHHRRGCCRPWHRHHRHHGWNRGWGHRHHRHHRGHHKNLRFGGHKGHERK